MVRTPLWLRTLIRRIPSTYQLPHTPSCQLEKLLRIPREDVGKVLVTDFCRLHFLESCGMLVACRVGIEEAAEDQPVRPHRFDELPEIVRAANVGRVKKDIRRPLRNVQDELAIRIRR